MSNTDREENRKKSKRKNLGLKIAIVFFLVIVIGLYIFIYVTPKVSNLFTDKYTAKYDTLSVGIETDYLVIRNEEVYKATKQGTVTRKVDQGELLKAKRQVVTLGKDNIYSKSRGIISYYYDGFEDKFTIKDVSSLKSSAIRSVITDEVDLASAYKENLLKEAVTSNAYANDVLFKIVDNQEWYIVTWLDKVAASTFKLGKTVVIKLADETELHTVVYQINEQDTLTQVVLSCNRYYEDFDKIRVGKGRIISTKKSGIVLETSSIYELEGTKGVTVLDKLGNEKFVPVKILATDGEKTVVEKNYFYDSNGNYTSTVKNYDTIKRVEKDD